MSRPGRARTHALVLSAAWLLASCTSGTKPVTETSGEPIDGRDYLPGVKTVYSANIDGEIEPCGCRSNPTGGLNRRYNFLEQKAQGERLMIDSGDLFYQSLPVPPFLEKQWNYQARVILKSYNALGVEAVEPGELDFADGLAMFESLASEAKFKFISANIYKKSDGKRLLEPYLILKKGGRKVAIFGLYDETLPLPDELEARDHLAAAAEMLSELRGKADVVFALTHLGVDKDTELAKQFSGIDAIFGAHTQSFLIRPIKVGDTLVFQPSFRGQHIGIFENGTNMMYQIDDRFDSKPEHGNPLDKLITDAKAEIERLNKVADAEMMGSGKPKPAAPAKHAGFLTFVQCAQCHQAQYQFHKTTPHMRAFATLVTKHAAANLDCLKCHTVGEGMSEGWKSVNNLALNLSGKAVDSASVAKSLPNMDIAALSKMSKVYFNVQCENCHGMGADHPMGASSISRKVSTDTCLNCHTSDRAPNWWKNGKPDAELIAAKLKSMTCPAMRK